jgi:hypothetical protein
MSQPKHADGGADRRARESAAQAADAGLTHELAHEVGAHLRARGEESVSSRCECDSACGQEARAQAHWSG